MKTNYQLIIIRGAPASGKSTLAQNMVEHFQTHSKVALLILDEFKWVMNAHQKRDVKDFALAFKNYLYVLENYLRAGYTIITEDVWTRVGADKSTDVSLVRKLGRKYDCQIYQILLSPPWKTISHQNTLRLMVLSRKDLKLQYDLIYNKRMSNEFIISIDHKMPHQVLDEAIGLIEG